MALMVRAYPYRFSKRRTHHQVLHSSHTKLISVSLPRLWSLVIIPTSIGNAKRLASHLAQPRSVDAYSETPTLRETSFHDDTLMSTSGVPNLLTRNSSLQKPSTTRTSGRLAAHALLHLHLRTGDSYNAGSTAERMIVQNIRIRTGTLEAVINSVCNDATPSAEIAAVCVKHGPAVPTLQATNFLYHGPRTAFQLLTLAREQGQRRSISMYSALIKKCVIHGEIVNSSLLYTLLVQDWKAWKDSLKAASVEAAVSVPDPSVQATDVPDNAQPQVPQIEVDMIEPPYPTAQLLGEITGGIHSMLSQDPRSPGEEGYLQEPLQALAILVSMVDNGHVHFGKLSSIISAVYHCPKTTHRVWVTKDGRLKLVKAYPYFHAFLLRIIKSFRNGEPLPFPSLDTRSYNALLNYTLRHRLSPAFASVVLEHMCGRPERMLQPSIETFNILTRSGTALGRLDISEAALTALRSVHNASNDSIAAPSSSLPVKKKKITHASKPHPHSPVPNAKLKLPAAVLAPDIPLSVDAYTLTGFIAHLTSAGESRLVAEALLYALPELSSVDHPTWNHLPLQPYGEIGEHYPRGVRLMRAACLGPHFYATLLHTLAKAGKTGLAERVWLLATQAQRASWIPGFTPEAAPWVLTIHAYTAMLQCYLLEAQRRRVPSLLAAEDRKWTPTADRPLRGWAQFVYQRAHVKAKPTEAAARVLLMRAMLSGGEGVYRALQDIRTASEIGTLGLVPPAPDRPFFNVALRLFSHQPAHLRPDSGPKQRGGKTAGATPRWTPLVQEVAEAMVAAGYPVPPEFRHLFAGRWEPGTQDFGPPPTLDRSPYARPAASSGTSTPRP